MPNGPYITSIIIYEDGKLQEKNKSTPASKDEAFAKVEEQNNELARVNNIYPGLSATGYVPLDQLDEIEKVNANIVNIMGPVIRDIKKLMYENSTKLLSHAYMITWVAEPPTPPPAPKLHGKKKERSIQKAIYYAEYNKKYDHYEYLMANFKEIMNGSFFKNQ